MRHSTTTAMLCVLLAAALPFACTTKFEESDANEEDPGEISPDFTEDMAELGDDAGPETADVPDNADAPDMEAESQCGNSVQEPGEECDDGNPENGDGCDNDCTFSCVGDGDCPDDRRACNGTEFCNIPNHVCDHRDPPPPGTACPEADFCREGACNASHVCVAGDEIFILHNVIQIAAGYRHTCALIQGGGVKCWGYNEFGQVGDGSTDNRSAPVDVEGLSSGVQFLTAGGLHTCAVMMGGMGMKCWGYGIDGQLGNGTTSGSPVPVDVTGLTPTPIITAAAGGFHTCILLGTGGIKCWGQNTEGQLGNGTTTGSNIPADVPSLTSGVVDIAAGRTHTCAVLSTYGVMCWGSNRTGELGNGEAVIVPNPTPVAVDPAAGEAAYVTAGGVRDLPGNPMGHTCSLSRTGGVMCWGNNDNGQLGDGTTTQRNTPVPVATLALNVEQLSAGGTHTCALMTNTDLLCWGDNSQGQLGNGSRTDQAVPFNVDNHIIEVSSGQLHTCALMDGGSVRCWGDNSMGALGDGTTEDKLIPTTVLCH